jgi:hypothetical protein
MQRREFLGALGGAVVALPGALRAQQPEAPLVGFVSISDREIALQAIWHQAFFQPAIWVGCPGAMS